MNTRRPAPISPVTRSSTVTRAEVTRCATALNKVPSRGPVEQQGDEAGLRCDALGDLANRIQPSIQQVARHHVAERLDHRRLHVRMLALELDNQPLDALPLQAEIAAGRATAADDGELAL